jgi:hypothetical protein
MGSKARASRRRLILEKWKCDICSTILGLDPMNQTVIDNRILCPNCATEWFKKTKACMFGIDPLTYRPLLSNKHGLYCKNKATVILPFTYGYLGSGPLVVDVPICDFHKKEFLKKEIRTRLAGAEQGYNHTEFSRGLCLCCCKPLTEEDLVPLDHHYCLKCYKNLDSGFFCSLHNPEKSIEGEQEKLAILKAIASKAYLKEHDKH